VLKIHWRTLNKMHKEVFAYEYENIDWNKTSSCSYYGRLENLENCLHRFTSNFIVCGIYISLESETHEYRNTMIGISIHRNRNT